MGFPQTRMRRLRRTEPLRSLVRETSLDPGDLIYPALYLSRRRRPQARQLHARRLQSLHRRSRPRSRRSRQPRHRRTAALRPARNQRRSKAPAHGTKTESSSRACAPSSNLRRAKKLVLIADVCLCEYTSHGHCGVVVENRRRLRRRQRSHPRSARPHRRQPGPGRSRRRRPQRHDGRPRRRHPQRPRRRGSAPTRPSSATPPNSPRPSTAPSAKPPTPRRNSATAAPIRWTAPTSAKPCAKSISTSTKAPT